MHVMFVTVCTLRHHRCVFLQSSLSPSAGEVFGANEACAVHKVGALLRRLKEAALLSGIADIASFMSWLFTLPNVTLTDGVMEDPHDLLVPLWQVMTMAGGSCYEQCGDSCGNLQIHINMMSLGVNVSNEYECSTCRGRWMRDDNGYEWCVSLSVPNQREVSVASLLYHHCTEGVHESVNSRVCSCRSDAISHSVRVRKVLSTSDESQGKAVAILASSVYFGSDGRRYKYTDRHCVPSLDISVGGKAYTLSSFIEHRPLDSRIIHSADAGHYVAYVRQSDDGTVWKVANDGDEQLRTWAQVAGVHGHMFFYTE